MLKLFRKKIVSKIILWGLLILILPAFVMWGSASSSRPKDKGPNYVGIIGDKKVSFEEFYGALIGVRSQVILNYFNQPKVLESLMGNKPLLAKIAWDRLIMLNEAKKMKIKVSDKEVIQFIQTHPLFLRNGGFDDRFYAYILHNNVGLEPRAFEETARETISIQKLTNAIIGDLKVSDTEVADEYKKAFGKIKIAYLLIEPKDFLGKAKIDEAAAKDYYEKNKTNLILKSNLKGAIPDRLATFEEARDVIGKYLIESQAVTLASKEAEDIYKKISEEAAKGGDDFKKIAKKSGLEVKESALISMGDNLDDLGPASLLIEAAYGLKDSEVSKPINVKKGFLIFRVVSREGADEEKFKKEKEEFAKKVRELKTNLIMEEWLKKAETKATLAIKLEEAEKYYK